MKYLIFGNGYLGNLFNQSLKSSIISSVYIESEQDVLQEIKKHQPDWILNCAGATGRPNIDWCEDNKQKTFKSNVLIPLMIAKACLKRNVRMLHLGSGCVYLGDNKGKGWSEDDPPNFGGSFYSKTKALSEDMLKDYNVLQLRLRMPIDNDLNSPRNFIKKILNYKKVINIKNSMTIVDDLLKTAEYLMKKNKAGIYNVVNPGPMSHKQILDLYKKIIDPKFKYTIISLKELYKTVKAERSNCVLNNKKLEKEIKLPSLKNQIIKIFKNYKNQT